MQKIDTNWRAGEPRDLGNGLRLRWSRVDDTEAIFQLAGQVFRNHETAPFNADTAGWILDLMSGEHPLMGPDDFLLVEDLAADKPEPVAITCYWHHTWEYGGTPFRVGRPEIVATQPAYRQRGLVRALFEELHKRSQAEGDLAQVITGIPYFYRQFGYEYALDLSGGRMVPLVNIPAAQEGQ
ncbi:MAG TPA: GNAT family N-acetyltransferase, partial [Ktedonobacteraceae bacterium]|nr:GNAT family N-acetyltransferase [Ktedonobacteraceae bacterium]